MKLTTTEYVRPIASVVVVRIEKGFAATGGFEQPSDGGETDL